MQIGVQNRATDEGLHPCELGRMVEGMGFESLFCADHPHIPVDAESKNPGKPDDFHAREYLRIVDPFVHLSAVAAVTSEIKLGTSVCLVVEREPLLLGKQVSTLDYVSNGRVILGVGAGWNREEMLNVGTDPRTRMKLMKERVLAMRQLWTEEEAEFRGELVNFGPVYSWPKPVQPAGPPVLIGGLGPTVIQRVIDYADGWIPYLSDEGVANDMNTDDARALAERLAELEQAGRARGKPFHVTLQLRFLQDGLARVFEKVAALGVDRCIVQISGGPPERTRAELEITQKNMRAFRGD